MAEVLEIPVSAESPSARYAQTPTPDPFSLVIFGATGDLTRRKLIPAVCKLYKQHLLPDQFNIIAYARRDYNDQSFRDLMVEALTDSSGFDASDQELLNRFVRNIYYQRGDLDDPAGFDSLKQRLEQVSSEKNMPANVLFYLSTQPGFFTAIAAHLKQAGLTHTTAETSPWSRIIIEKPFGHDLQSALELNKKITQAFAESQIYRIDHYLGKETVQNILVLRFANSIFEPIWNKTYVDHVQITVAETLGVEGRAGYYDKAGALRDIVQNHMMHLLSLVGMEAPVSLDADAVRDEKVKVLKALRPYSDECVRSDVVRARYVAGTVNNQKVAGYLQEPGVAQDSNTETYCAFKLLIDNWRWAGVPFYMRTGKRLPDRVTEIAIHFKSVPNVLFNLAPFGPMEPNVLVMRIQPNESILLQFQVKFPGPTMRIEPLKMDFDYSDTFGKDPPAAYERLLLDAALGDSTLFTRSDEVETAWAFFEPVLRCETDPHALPAYIAGSWGPTLADELLAKDNRQWRIFQPPKGRDRCYI